MGDRPKCAETVYPSRGWGCHRCTRTALPGQKFCKQHSPEYKAEQERKSQERYAAQRAEHKAAQERGAVALLRGLGYTVIAPGTPAGGDADA